MTARTLSADILISLFCSVTFSPLVLNISSNETNRSSATSRGAFACFLRTSMDVLIVASFFIERRTKKSESNAATEAADRLSPTGTGNRHSEVSRRYWLLSAGDQVHMPDWAGKICVGWFFRIASQPRLYFNRYITAFSFPRMMIKFGRRLPSLTLLH